MGRSRDRAGSDRTPQPLPPGAPPSDWGARRAASVPRPVDRTPQIKTGSAGLAGAALLPEGCRRELRRWAKLAAPGISVRAAIQGVRPVLPRPARAVSASRAATAGD